MDGLFRELVMSCSWYPECVVCRGFRMRTGLVKKVNAVMFRLPRNMELNNESNNESVICGHGGFE